MNERQERDVLVGLASAGDWDGVKRELQAQHERFMAEFEAERQAEAQQRRTSADPYERAAQARFDGDPDWRSLMPVRWHVSRSWDIYSVPLGLTVLIIGGAVALMWWLT